MDWWHYPISNDKLDICPQTPGYQNQLGPFVFYRQELDL